MILDGTCIYHGTSETETLSKKAIKELSDENEGVLLTKVEQILRVINPAFDARSHGSKSLHLLMSRNPTSSISKVANVAEYHPNTWSG